MRRLTLVACLVLAAVVVEAGEQGWIDLFNGKDLKGWVTSGKNWRVITEGGEPVIECFKGGPSVTYEKPFGDAIFDVWFRLPPGHNSGLFFRGSRIVPGGYPPPGTSYELQLYDHKGMWGHRTGDLLYAHRARRWASKPGLWNRCTMISVAYRHKAYLNGQCIYDIVDKVPPLKGYVCLQSHGHTVYFKRVRIKEIADGRWPEETGRLKALLFVGESRGIGKRVDLHGALIEKFLDDTARFEITWTPEEIALDPQYLRYYDLLILYDNRPNLPPARQKQIAEFVRNGGGLVVLNRSAIGTFQNWPEFRSIVCAEQTGSKWSGVGDVGVRVADTSHPVAAGVKPFRLRDTFCGNVRLAPGGHPVLALAREMPEPIGWAAAFGKGKVFCLVLGQEAGTLTNPDFQRVVVNAASWVCLPDPTKQMLALAANKDAAGLAKMLHEPPIRADWPVLEALARVGTPAAAEALAKAASGSGELLLRTAAVANLARIEGAGLDSLHRLLASGKPEIIRVGAADALGARAAAASIGPLAKALADPSGLVREKAIDALGRIRSPEAEAVVLGKLTGDDPSWYEVALAALGRADSPKARTALVAIAKSRGGKYRAVLPAVASALAAQMKHPEVFAALTALLDAPEPDARITAARALIESKDPRVHDLMLPRVFGRDAALARIAEDYVRAAGKVDLAKHLSPFIRGWMIVGPFSNEGGRGARTAYPPEKELKLDAAYDGVGGKVRWQAVKATGDHVDLAKLFPKHSQNTVAYATVVIESPADREVQMRTGSDDGIVAWLNGKEILRVNRPRGLTIDEDRTPIRLNKGENRLLLKILQGGGDWSFCVRLADPKGALAGLKCHMPGQGAP